VADNRKRVNCTLWDGRVLRVTTLEPRNVACYGIVHRDEFFGIMCFK